MEIEELRKQEDSQIIENLKSIADITFAKCKRCTNQYSCMGCTYNLREMGYYIKECMWLMRSTKANSDDSLGEYISKFNELIGEVPKVEPPKKNSNNGLITFLIIVICILAIALIF